MDNRTIAQRWADKTTEFSGSWAFILSGLAISSIWLLVNMTSNKPFDPYPFLLFNMTLTLISTFQSPLILMSQNRQNENDRAITQEMLKRLTDLQEAVDKLKK